MKKPTHVLIIEDDIWLAEQHERVLKTAGHTTALAHSTVEAINLIDDKRPDVIILDLLLTGQNAFVFLHELRSHEDLATIPVILCTNTPEVVIGEDTSAYGISTVLDKSEMTPGDLLASVKKVLLWPQ